MTPSLRSHLANLLADKNFDTQPTNYDLAAALLADPTLAAIIDLAAKWDKYEVLLIEWGVSPEVRALLAAWRAER